MNIIVKRHRLHWSIKLILILIPLGVFGYLIFQNFIIDQNFNYFYDIGGQTDSVKPYLTPLNRTSEYTLDRAISYRQIVHRLTYFSIPYTKGSDQISVDVRFVTDLNLSTFKFGIKNNTGWNYTWLPLENPVEDDSWSIISGSFSLAEAYPENNKLNLALDIPEISKNEGNSTFHIDWINITVHKPGMFE